MVCAQYPSTFILTKGNDRSSSNMQYSLLAVFASLVATAQATAIEARNDFLSCNNYHFATLSDCQALLSNDTIWNAAWAGTDNVC